MTTHTMYTTAAPPHVERPNAATDEHHHRRLHWSSPQAAPPPTSRPSRSRRLRRRLSGRALLLTAAVVAVGGLAAGCGFGFGPDAAIAPAPPNPSEAVIREVFGPLGVADQAVSVAQCESGLNAGAGGYHKGLFQLGPHLAGTIDFYGGNWYDPLTNAQVARDLYLQNGGWASWPSCGTR